MQRFPSRDDEEYQDMLIWIREWVKDAKGVVLGRQAEKERVRTQEQQDSLKSLAFPEMNVRGNDIQEAAAETCAWLLKHKNYKAWLDQHQGLLWIKGCPGAGKSTLLKYVLHRAKQQASRNKEVIASFFFHDRGAALQKNPLGMYRSLLHQLLDQIPDMLVEFTAIHEKKCKTEGKQRENWEWHEAELRSFLEASMAQISTANRIWIYVDALDECGKDTAKDLAKFFQRLVSQLTPSDAGLRICFSCRHYPVVALDYGFTICVEDENQQDILTYVEDEFKRASLDHSKGQELKKFVVDRASGIFQWVVLVVPMVVKLHDGGKSTKAIYSRLKLIPADLYRLYEMILSSVDKEDLSQSFLLMQWICFARQPLSMAELRYALVMDAATPYSSLRECEDSVHYVENDENMAKMVRSLSGGLIEVRQHQSQRIAQFIHLSVKDYLLQNGLERLCGSHFQDMTGVSHFRISRSCIKYLTMHEVLSYTAGGRRFPFLPYATINWISHAKVVEVKKMPQDDLLDLFRWPSNQVTQSWTSLYQEIDRRSEECPVTESTLLHIASRHGLFRVIEAILYSTGSLNLDPRDRKGQTPLMYASSYGHEAVVKLLLETGEVDVNAKNYSGDTPLIYAFKSEQEA
ncbi:hypothetical protein AOQ84DRAFT_316195, partial [Glonium stellatum]